MKRGDIYLVTLGHEQQGTRPVLIVSPERFNAVTHAPIVVPITSGGAFVGVVNVPSVTRFVCHQVRLSPGSSSPGSSHQVRHQVRRHQVRRHQVRQEDNSL